MKRRTCVPVTLLAGAEGPEKQCTFELRTLDFVKLSVPEVLGSFWDDFVVELDVNSAKGLPVDRDVHRADFAARSLLCKEIIERLNFVGFKSCSREFVDV